MEEYTILIDEGTLAFYIALEHISGKPHGQLMSEVLQRNAHEFAAKIMGLVEGREDTIVYYDNQKKRL